MAFCTGWITAVVGVATEAFFQICGRPFVRSSTWFERPTGAGMGTRIHHLGAMAVDTKRPVLMAGIAGFLVAAGI